MESSNDLLSMMQKGLLANKKSKEKKLEKIKIQTDEPNSNLSPTKIFKLLNSILNNNGITFFFNSSNSNYLFDKYVNKLIKEFESSKNSLAKYFINLASWWKFIVPSIYEITNSNTNVYSDSNVLYFEDYYYNRDLVDDYLKTVSYKKLSPSDYYSNPITCHQIWDIVGDQKDDTYLNKVFGFDTYLDYEIMRSRFVLTSNYKDVIDMVYPWDTSNFVGNKYDLEDIVFNLRKLNFFVSRFSDPSLALTYSNNVKDVMNLLNKKSNILVVGHNVVHMQYLYNIIAISFALTNKSPVIGFDTVDFSDVVYGKYDNQYFSCQQLLDLAKKSRLLILNNFSVSNKTFKDYNQGTLMSIIQYRSLYSSFKNIVTIILDSREFERSKQTKLLFSKLEKSLPKEVYEYLVETSEVYYADPKTNLTSINQE